MTPTYTSSASLTNRLTNSVLCIRRIKIKKSKSNVDADQTKYHLVAVGLRVRSDNKDEWNDSHILLQIYLLIRIILKQIHSTNLYLLFMILSIVQ